MENEEFIPNMENEEYIPSLEEIEEAERFVERMKTLEAQGKSTAEIVQIFKDEDKQKTETATETMIKMLKDKDYSARKGGASVERTKRFVELMNFHIARKADQTAKEKELVLETMRKDTKKGR